MYKQKRVNNKLQIGALILILLATLILAGAAWAGNSASYTVRWQVFSGGGEPVESASGVVVLNGSLGQMATGISNASQANLGAGFWFGMNLEDMWASLRTYLPITLRNP
jgi:hypothetical protein